MRGEDGLSHKRIEVSPLAGNYEGASNQARANQSSLALQVAHEQDFTRGLDNEDCANFLKSRRLGAKRRLASEEFGPGLTVPVPLPAYLLAMRSTPAGLRCLATPAIRRTFSFWYARGAEDLCPS